MTNNWEAWDAKKRGEHVRVTQVSPGRSKVTSGGKHLGNIEQRGGKHTAVVQNGPGRLSSTEHSSHQAALNHIRKTHGLPAETAARPSTAEQHAAAIRSALGHTTSAHSVATHGSGGSVARRTTKTDLKRPAPVKGEKDQADSFRTRIRMAEYNRKKAAATASDPVNKRTPSVEQAVNSHTSSANKIARAVREPRPAVQDRPDAGSLEDLANKADAATRQAQRYPTEQSHRAARDAHQLAERKAYAGSSKTVDRHAAQYHSMMQGYHARAAHGRLTPEIQEEHVDGTVPALPGDTHHLLSAGQDTESRRRSAHNYESVRSAASSPIDASQQQAVAWYTRRGDQVMNGHLRGTQPLSDPAELGQATHGVNNLDGAFAAQTPLGHDVLAYRGVMDPVGMFGPPGSSVGKEFMDPGYTSTTSHASTANGFGTTLVRVLHPAGSRVLKPSTLGKFGDSENELMAPRGSRFHVVADRVVTTYDGQHKRIVDLVRKDV